MKKIALFASLAFFFCNFVVYLSEKQEVVTTHAVSINPAKAKTTIDLTKDNPVKIPETQAKEQKKENFQDFASLFPNLQITGNLSVKRQELIQKTLRELPIEKLQQLKHIQIKNVKGESRGLGGSNLIILNQYELEDEEFVAVLVHELGHAIDLGGLQGNPLAPRSVFNDGTTPIYTNDPSTKYYAYSWENSLEHKKQAKNKDFVSGYAMTDPFEDFAESFAYYVLHNADFKILAKRNKQLELKYAYIRDFVFDGKELETGTGEVHPNRRVWDITKLAIEL